MNKRIIWERYEENITSAMACAAYLQFGLRRTINLDPMCPTRSVPNTYKLNT